MKRPAQVDEIQEWRENLAAIYTLIRQQQRILFRTQAAAEALLATLRDLKLERVEQTFDVQYHQALAGRVAEAQSIATSSLDTLVGVSALTQANRLDTCIDLLREQESYESTNQTEPDRRDAM